MNCSTNYAPWWSTKSCEGQVIRELAVVSSIHLEHVGADSFGQLISGHVCFTGPLAEVRLGNNRDIYHNRHELAGHYELDVWPRVDGNKYGVNLIFLGLYSVAAPSSSDE